MPHPNSHAKAGSCKVGVKRELHASVDRGDDLPAFFPQVGPPRAAEGRSHRRGRCRRGAPAGGGPAILAHRGAVVPRFPAECRKESVR